MHRRVGRSGSRADAVAAVLLVALPAALLWRPLFLGYDFVPFDLSTFPPYSTSLSVDELAQRRVGSNFDVTEKTLVCAPEYELAQRELEAGRSPQWNPYVRTGAPLFANALSGFAYPTHWLFFLLGPERGFGFAAWISLATAGLLMYGFLRSIRLEAISAVFGALVFQLSGTMVANAHFFMRMDTLIWLPGGFWALRVLSRRRGVRRVPPLVAFAACVALTWLAGFPPFALAVSCAFAAYVGYLAWGARRRRGVGGAGRLLAAAAVGTSLGLFLAAVQIVPMLDYFSQSSRDINPPAHMLAAGGLDPLGWLSLLLPAPFGTPMGSTELPYDRNPLMYLLTTRANAATGALFLPNYNATEYALYLGGFPILCAALALTRRNGSFRWFAIAATVSFLFLASGGALFRLVAQIPWFRSGPPMRFAAVVPFFLASLAAMGLAGGPDRWSRTGRAVVILAAVLLSVVCLGTSLYATMLGTTLERTTAELCDVVSARFQPFYGDAATPERTRELFGPFVGPALRHLSSQAAHGSIVFALGAVWLLGFPARSGEFRVRLWKGLAVVAVAAELFLLARPLNPSFPHRALHDTPVHDFLEARRDERQESGGFTVARAASHVMLPTALPPNLLMSLRIRDLNSYAFVDKWSHLPFVRLYGQEINGGRAPVLLAFPDDQRLDYGLFDLFGVRYLLSEEVLPRRGATAIPPLSGPGGSFFLYERSTALPRAFFVRAARPATDEQALAAMTADDFSATAEAFLHEVVDGRAGDLDELHADAVPSSLLEDAVVRFRRDTPTDVSIDIERSPGAWLMLVDSAMPHWKAILDASPVPWRRADLLFRAVWIPPGNHRLRFVYDPVPYRLGRALTFGTLAVCVLLVVVAARRPSDSTMHTATW